jgi:hypothetical protein
MTNIEEIIQGVVLITLGFCGEDHAEKVAVKIEPP